MSRFSELIRQGLERTGKMASEAEELGKKLEKEFLTIEEINEELREVTITE